MSYRILNRLFGWDYVQWSNCVTSGVSRVHLDGRGRAFYWRYKSIGVADRIHKPEEVLWLTCSPDKYFKAGAWRWAVSDLQRDIERIAGPLWDKGTMRHWEAWQRIRARLTPDRERVARAIAFAHWGDDEFWEQYLVDADAAINAMGEP